MIRLSVSREVEEEIAFHIEMTTRELVTAGLSPENARAEAARRFGSVDVVNAACQQLGRSRERRSKRAEVHLEILQDLRIALRQLIRAKAFTVIAVLTLALGIGATSTVFSALYAVVLRPLPFVNPERVVVLQSSEMGELLSPTAAEFVAMRDHVPEFSHVAAAVQSAGFTITDGELPQLVGGARASASFFEVFAVKPELGRVFTREDDMPGRNNVVVLSHRAWVSRYNSDAGILGRTIHLNGESHVVIGVMPAVFDITNDGDELWVPLALTPEALANSGSRYLSVFARLAPGVSLEKARAAATAVERTTVANFPERKTPASKASIAITPFADDLIGSFRSLLLILLGAVGFVLLIACTNVANLLLARGTARAKELAIRAALGAGRGRLIRQLLTESVLLALIGAVSGIGLAFVLLQVLLRVSPADIPRLNQAHIDWHVIAFTLVTAAVCSLFFGLVPALRAAGPQLQGTLREGGRESAVSGRGPLRQMLVACEVALAMALVTGAGLLIRSVWLLQQVNPGFEPRGVMTARILLPESRYASGASIVRAYAEMRMGAQQLPGVTTAALVSVLPLSGSQMKASLFSDKQNSATDKAFGANLRLASGDYFRTMQIPVLAGRDIANSDNVSAPPVIVVNEQLAHKLWPDVASRNVLGRRINALALSRAEPHWMTVIGVVGNIRDGSLATPVEPEFYIPVEQTPEHIWPYLQRSLVLLVRGANAESPATTFTTPLAKVVKSVDATVPLAEARSMASFVQSSMETARFNTLLLSTLGGVALTLAMVGVYGVVAWFVSQRTHEIGVRMALGATPSAIWQLVAYRGLKPIIAGMFCGVALSLITSSVLQDQLYGVSKGDPITFAMVAALLLGVSALATYVPARRAMRVSPVEALTA